MRVFGLVGRPQNGSTELMSRLIAELVARGIRVSAVTAAPCGFDIDKPGKDSFQHRAAGAREVMLASSHRWALMHERRDQAGRAPLAAILDRMTPVALVLADGFPGEPHPKLEIHHPDGQPPLAHGDPTIVAVASDRRLEGLAVPLLDLADTASIAAFVLDHCGLTAEPAQGDPDPAARLGLAGSHS